MTFKLKIEIEAIKLINRLNQLAVQAKDKGNKGDVSKLRVFADSVTAGLIEFKK